VGVETSEPEAHGIREVAGQKSADPCHEKVVGQHQEHIAHETEDEGDYEQRSLAFARGMDQQRRSDQENHHGGLGHVLELSAVPQDRGQVAAGGRSGEDEGGQGRRVHRVTIIGALRAEGPGRNDVIDG
jgi:hypothetical protein